MRKTWSIVVLSAAVCLAGCAAVAPPASDADDAAYSEEHGVGEDHAADGDFTDGGLPEAHSAFATHFTDPVYDDPASEFAPFGSDEGWDLLYEWAERRDELASITTVAGLIDESGFGGVVTQLDTPEGPGVPVPGGQVDAATVTIGAGFTLLRLTGGIDEAGRQQVLKALGILIRRYDAPAELVRQRSDLQAWDG